MSEKTTWPRTCQTKTAPQTFEKMQKVLDETTISLDSSTVKQAFLSANLRLVYLSFCDQLCSLSNCGGNPVEHKSLTPILLYPLHRRWRSCCQCASVLGN